MVFWDQFLMTTLTKNYRIPLTLMGVLAPGFSHARGLGPVPHQHEQKNVSTCVCKVTFKHLPQPLRSHIQSFRTIGQFFKIPPLSDHAKYQNPTPTLSCRERERTREIMPGIMSATLAHWRTHPAWTKTFI